jgi:hypothetical protein
MLGSPLISIAPDAHASTLFSGIIQENRGQAVVFGPKNRTGLV